MKSYVQQLDGEMANMRSQKQSILALAERPFQPTTVTASDTFSTTPETEIELEPVSTTASTATPVGKTQAT